MSNSRKDEDANLTEEEKKIQLDRKRRSEAFEELINIEKNYNASLEQLNKILSNSQNSYLAELKEIVVKLHSISKDTIENLESTRPLLTEKLAGSELSNERKELQDQRLKIVGRFTEAMKEYFPLFAAYAEQVKQKQITYDSNLYNLLMRPNQHGVHYELILKNLLKSITDENQRTLANEFLTSLQEGQNLLFKSPKSFWDRHPLLTAALIGGGIALLGIIAVGITVATGGFGLPVLAGFATAAAALINASVGVLGVAGTIAAGIGAGVAAIGLTAGAAVVAKKAITKEPELKPVAGQSANFSSNARIKIATGDNNGAKPSQSSPPKPPMRSSSLPSKSRPPEPPMRSSSLAKGQTPAPTKK